MKKEKSAELKKDLKEDFKKFGLFLIIFYIFFQIWYIKDSPVNVIKVVLSQFYLFILPGFMLMLYFRDKIEFIYRLLIGIVVGYSAGILLTIYINVILKTNISNIYLISPLILIVLGIILFINKNS